MKLCVFLLSSLVAEVYPGPVSVSISAVYAPAPREAPGILDPNQFTAGSILTLRCSAQGLSGNLSYRWSVSGNTSSSDCTSCAINVSSTTSTLDLENLYPYFAGTYKCAVSGTQGSPLHCAYFIVTVVGEFTIIIIIVSIMCVLVGISVCFSFDEKQCMKLYIFYRAR